MQNRMELLLRGLCSFCPSVDCMKTLVINLRLKVLDLLSLSWQEGVGAPD